jgi:hypothetical protein
MKVYGRGFGHILCLTPAQTLASSSWKDEEIYQLPPRHRRDLFSTPLGFVAGAYKLLICKDKSTEEKAYKFNSILIFYVVQKPSQKETKTLKFDMGLTYHFNKQG